MWFHPQTPILVIADVPKLPYRGGTGPARSPAHPGILPTMLPAFVLSPLHNARARNAGYETGKQRYFVNAAKPAKESFKVARTSELAASSLSKLDKNG